MSARTPRGGRRKAYYLFHRTLGTVTAFLGAVVFFTGAVAVFGHELGHWASRDVEAAPLEALGPGVLDRSLATALATLEGEPAETGRSALVYAEKPDVLTFSFVVPGEETRDFVDVRIPEGTLVAQQRETFGERSDRDPRAMLESFFVRLHVSLLVEGKLGLLLTGLIAIALLLLLGSGLYVHWPRRKQLVQAPRRGVRQRLGDVHTLVGAWTLPFSFVLSVTGAFFSFAGAVLLPVMIVVAFGGDRARMEEVLRGEVPSSETAAVASLDAIVQDAKVRAGAAELGRLRLEGWDTPNAHVVTEFFDLDYSLTSVRYAYGGHDGEFLGERPFIGARPSLGGTLISWVAGLHFGNLYGLATKLAWMVFGLLACLLAATGLGLWAVRNAKKAPREAAVARAFAGGTAGLPFATGLTIVAWAFVQDGPTWNAMAVAFFLALAAATLAAGRLPMRAALRGVFAAGAMALAAAPFAGAMVTGGQAFAMAGEGAEIDVGLALFALLLGLAALRLPRLEAKGAREPAAGFGETVEEG
ncbi:MAG: PepSY-associated TM helix domain-containing protein, partial [Myxococcota bacterium]